MGDCRVARFLNDRFTYLVSSFVCQSVQIEACVSIAGNSRDSQHIRTVLWKRRRNSHQVSSFFFFLFSLSPSFKELKRLPLVEERGKYQLAAWAGNLLLLFGDWINWKKLARLYLIWSTKKRASFLTCQTVARVLEHTKKKSREKKKQDKEKTTHRRRKKMMRKGDEEEEENAPSARGHSRKKKGSQQEITSDQETRNKTKLKKNKREKEREKKAQASLNMSLPIRHSVAIIDEMAADKRGMRSRFSFSSIHFLFPIADFFSALFTNGERRVLILRLTRKKSNAARFNEAVRAVFPNDGSLTKLGRLVYICGHEEESAEQ